MNRLIEIRSQEFLCRERAALDWERRVFWLAQAQEWEQRALDEDFLLGWRAELVSEDHRREVADHGRLALRIVVQPDAEPVEVLADHREREV